MTDRELRAFQQQVRERDAKYWLYEEPEVMELERNVIRYYPKAGRLSFHMPDFYSSKYHKNVVGKGVSIRMEDLETEPQFIRRLIDILTALLPGNGKEGK